MMTAARLVRDDIERGRGVVDVDEAAALAARPVDRQGTATHGQAQELRDDFFRVLPRAIDLG